MSVCVCETIDNYVRIGWHAASHSMPDGKHPDLDSGNSRSSCSLEDTDNGKVLLVKERVGVSSASE